MAGFIDEEGLHELIRAAKDPASDYCRKAIRKAMRLEGLEPSEAAALLQTADPEVVKELFQAAKEVKDRIYGTRLVLFAPLYVSSFCVNDCTYCGFHAGNKSPRRKLTTDELRQQVKTLIDMGHKRLLLEFGEHPDENPIDYVVDTIKTIYSVKSGNGEIRRVNVNIAATSVEDYRKLKEAGIGTYQLFQETYHRKTYERLHKGPKADYERQLYAHDRAFEAGIDDLGLGALFGLYDYRFEALALLAHARHMSEELGVGPHTISFPRWRPADNVGWSSPPHPVSEEDLLRTIAVLRLAVPYTGMIISTRESPEFRKRAFEVGISQTSAASRTSPGGYGKAEEAAQFSVADDRKVDEVIAGVLAQGLLPSFCTACYRSGRTGDRFMEYAKNGRIQDFCLPNAILTFKEYLVDYGDGPLREKGAKTIAKELENIPDKAVRAKTKERLIRVEEGERDLYF